MKRRSFMNIAGASAAVSASLAAKGLLTIDILAGGLVFVLLAGLDRAAAPDLSRSGGVSGAQSP